MTGAITLLRALAHRAGTTVVILLVALCAAAAATIGPSYYVAAKHSIVQDTLTTGSVVGRGFESTQQGAVQGTADAMLASLDTVTAQVLHGRRNVDRLFNPPVRALETNRFFASSSENTLLAWRTGVCAHLHLHAGHCPTAQSEIIISRSLAQTNHWTVGERVRPAASPPLTITGIYDPPAATDDYWFGRGDIYFPYEAQTAASVSAYDTMFTPRSTIESLHGNPQGSDVVSRTLRVPQVLPADVDPLARLGDRLPVAPALTNVSTLSGLAGTGEQVHSSWSALAVPVVVVTAELLVLTWLLLFLVVTDAVEARGTEIALAKLRGYGAVRSLVFGLAEPASLLLLALPLGALLGWLSTSLLARVLLRPGTPVGLPGLGWLGAAIAVVGGLAAVVVAARRTLTRPVVEEWRRAGRRATDRSWLFDAVVLTAAVAGLVQLLTSGSLGSAKHSALALLVPGLLGLAVAVVSSRLLPLLCRATFARTRRRGTLGPFLAVRHIARRPGGTRTTMILGTAVALATFSIASWSVSKDNRSRVASATVGAPTVLTVVPSSASDLVAAVNRVDPGGTHASAVVSYDSGNTVLLGVQPQRFAHVASWGATDVHDQSALLSGLSPSAPAPIVLTGSDVRLHFDVGRLTLPAQATLDVVAKNNTAPTPVDLGVIHEGRSVVRTGSLAGCPCVIRDLQLPPAGVAAAPIAGAVTIGGIDVRDHGRWSPVPGALNPGSWVDTDNQRVSVSASAGGLAWHFFAVKGVPPTLRTHDRPEPLPAVLAAPVAAGDATTTVSGLDAADLPLTVTGRAAGIPSAPHTGVVVDLTYAERAAYGNVGPSTQQVWVRGPVAPIAAGLAKAGVAVVATASSGALDDELSRQGPGLASVLFLADAIAAAILAGLAAILSLSAAARRRRYEYAALGATGADGRTLYTALALEQTAVVGFGCLAGVIAGVVSIAIAGHSVPEFVVAPVATLHYRPSILLLVVVLGLGFVLLLTAALLAAAALLRSVTPDQLREAQA